MSRFKHISKGTDFISKGTDFISKYTDFIRRPGKHGFISKVHTLLVSYRF